MAAEAAWEVHPHHRRTGSAACRSVLAHRRFSITPPSTTVKSPRYEDDVDDAGRNNCLACLYLTHVRAMSAVRIAK